jgi:hypothetical protein
MEKNVDRLGNRARNAAIAALGGLVLFAARKPQTKSVWSTCRVGGWPLRLYQSATGMPMLLGR